MVEIEKFAPSGLLVDDRDQRNLALYAALLDADDAGLDWRDVAVSILKLDITSNDAEACWRSYLERARWIVGDGLAQAIVALGSQNRQI